MTVFLQCYGIIPVQYAFGEKYRLKFYKNITRKNVLLLFLSRVGPIIILQIIRNRER